MLNLGYKWVKSLHWMKLCIFSVRQGIVGRVFEYHWYAEPSTRRGWRSGKEIVFIHAPRKLPHQLYSYTHLRRIPPLFQAGFSTSPSIPLHLKYPDTKYQWNNSYNKALNTRYNACNIFLWGINIYKYSNETHWGITWCHTKSFILKCPQFALFLVGIGTFLSLSGGFPCQSDRPGWTRGQARPQPIKRNVL